MKCSLILSVSIFMTSLHAIAHPDTLIKLWNDKIPNAVLEHTVEEQVDISNNILAYAQVVDPTLEVYLPTPRAAKNIGVLIMPGGGYSRLAYDWEGRDVAKLLNAHGIAAFVLKYRLPDPSSSELPHLSPLLDARRAMRIIRQNAVAWNVDQSSVGAMGFSAGGHLAATLLTSKQDLSRFDMDAIDALEFLPSFGILIYPVTTMDKSYTHMGSRNRLLGESPNQELIDLYSPEFQVNSDVPPIFMVHSMDDAAVPIRGTLLLYQSLISHGIPTEAHFFPNGGHGYSLARKHEVLKKWPEMMVNWIESLPE